MLIGLLAVTICAAALSANVKVNWSHVDTSNAVVGYAIYYGPSSKNYTNSIRVGYVTNAIIPDLPSNSVTYVSAASVGINNFETDLGNEIQAIPTSDTNVPPSIRPTMVKNFTITQITKSIY